MVFFVRLFRGPPGGYVQTLPVLVHVEHGSFLSQRTFLLLQPLHERKIDGEADCCSDPGPGCDISPGRGESGMLLISE
jgi:hypothetical protein